MSDRKVRMGIDVGGTHTKAVAIDNATHEIIGKSSVKTTHDDKAGVAAGVVAAFQNCLRENNIDPKDVIFVAHSTTQATNALIEGDVAKVGVVGVGPKGIGGLIAKAQTNMKDINLGSGRFIRLKNRYICDEKLSDQAVTDTIKSLVGDGAEVIVASESFGVDDMENETGICKIAKDMGLEATAASEITKLYGLTRRTRTAAINASILPKMLNTANSTEQSVKSAGVEVPLMIMRGDGGVMEISEMKKRPVLTMLSGPAASVMGSLMYLRASNGVYFEVGGTTTNIGVIKDGRPAIDYSVVGGHRTYISSLDVRVLGVAGGSMVRADKNGVKDVGPRSAHIAGLDYAVFTPEDIRSIKAEAIDKAVESGAAADSVDVHIEIDPQTSKLTAIALGSTEVKTTDLLKECTAKEARELAAEDLKVAPSEVNEECATKNFYVFAIEGKGKHPIRILDKKGFIKVQRNDGKAILCKAGSYRNIVSQLWEELAIYQQDAILRPDYYICAGARVMDFSGSVDLDKIMMLMEVEMQMIDPGDDVIIVGAKNSL